MGGTLIRAAGPMTWCESSAGHDLGPRTMVRLRREPVKTFEGEKEVTATGRTQETTRRVERSKMRLVRPQA